jgi:TPR repeat protein
MKCILCAKCEAFHAALDKKRRAWLEAQSNNAAIMEREADPAAVHQAYDLLQTNPAQSFIQFLALAEQGSVWSMASVAQMLEVGTGTAKDLAQAERWYLRAYQAGSDYGLIWLGALYQRSGEYEKAQEVYRTGAERGFVPAMVRLAACYRNSPNWRQRRKEAMALLKRGSAAGDLFARYSLAIAMTRGWFGVRHIPEGFRRLSSVADEIMNLVKDDMTLAPSGNEARPGFLGRLAAPLWLLGAARRPAS